MPSDFSLLSQPGKRELDLVLDDGAVIRCEEVVRVVPGKRIVFRGHWQQQPIYAKLFIGSGAQRYAERDLQGVEALLAADIATPPLLHRANLAAGQAAILIFAAIDDSLNTEQAWATLSGAERFALAKKMVAEVARHHAAGLMQTDLYLKNFLIQGEKIYTLDGDGIRQLPYSRREHAALDNLARLLSKFDVIDAQNWLPELLALYAEARGLPASPDAKCMCRRIAVQRRMAATAYADSKVFRACTDIEVQQTWRAYTAIERAYASQNVKRALASPDALIANAERLLKQGNTCTVALLALDARKVVVKRYNIKRFWHGVGRAWRGSRAAASWANAHRLRIYGIATPAPLALVERRFGPLRRQAYFVMQHVAAADAAEFFADAERTQQQKAGLAENIARLFYKLNLLQLEHGDFKASNIKVVDLQPLLIDLDSMRQHRCRWLSERRHVRDLRRFMRNWQHDVALQKLLAAAFERAYQNPRLLQRAGIHY